MTVSDNSRSDPDLHCLLVNTERDIAILTLKNMRLKKKSSNVTKSQIYKENTFKNCSSWNLSSWLTFPKIKNIVEWQGKIQKITNRRLQLDKTGAFSEVFHFQWIQDFWGPGGQVLNLFMYLFIYLFIKF